MKNIFLVVKDEDGILRPMAGVWRSDESGKRSAEDYVKKNPEVTIVQVELIEL